MDTCNPLPFEFTSSQVICLIDILLLLSEITTIITRNTSRERITYSTLFWKSFFRYVHRIQKFKELITKSLYQKPLTSICRSRSLVFCSVVWLLYWQNALERAFKHAVTSKDISRQCLRASKGHRTRGNHHKTENIFSFKCLLAVSGSFKFPRMKKCASINWVHRCAKRGTAVTLSPGSSRFPRRGWNLKR